MKAWAQRHRRKEGIGGDVKKVLNHLSENSLMESRTTLKRMATMMF